MQRQCSIAIVSALFVAGLLAFPHTGRCESFNFGFETGDLTDWTAEGEAFEFQPTWGDNPTARGRGQASEHAGDWWLGLYEAYQGPEIGEALGQVAGAIQGDGPQGTLTSDDFSLIGETMNFLMFKRMCPPSGWPQWSVLYSVVAVFDEDGEPRVGAGRP